MNWSPRGKGPRPHAIVDRPLPLLSEPTPDWASAARTKNFIDMPFNGFLAPPSRSN